MNLSLKLALSLSLLFSLSLQAVTSGSARAGEPQENKTKNSEPVSASKQASKEAVGQAKPFLDFNQRLSRIQKQLAENLETGRLSPQQVEELQNSLEQISELCARFKLQPAKYRNWQLKRLQTLVDRLQDRMSRLEQDRALAAADLESTKNYILNRLNLAAKQGRLSPPEVADLKKQYDRIISLEEHLLKKQGSLNYHDKLALCIELDQLSSRLQSSLKTETLKEPDLNQETEEIKKKIDSALSDGRIKQSKADELKNKLSDLSKRYLSRKSENGRLSDEQILELGLGLETLANEAELSFDDELARISPDQKISELDKELAALLIEGRLKPLEFLELAGDLDEIRQNRANLGENPGQDDRIILLLDLTRYEGKLQKQAHEASRVWTGILVELSNLSARNKAALAANRILPEQSKSISEELDLLNKRLARIYEAAGSESKSSQEKLTSENPVKETLNLAQDLQSLSGRFEKALKSRNLEAPDTEALKKAIDSRVADYALLGQLSRGDARQAAATISELSKTRDRYAASQDNFSSEEKLELAFELERLALKLEEQVRGHEPYFPGMDTRRQQIGALILEGIASGRLDISSASYYRDKLLENSLREKEYRLSGMSAEKSIELVDTLEQLWLQLDRELRAKRLSLEDIASLSEKAEKKIRQGFCGGLLSISEAERLHDAYKRLEDATQQMQSEDGGISYGEKLAILYGYERLMAQSERNLRALPLQIPDLDEKNKDLKKQLAAELAAGKLSLQEAYELKGLLDEIDSNAARHRASAGGISYQEFLLLAFDMNRIAKLITAKALANKQNLPDLDSLQSRLQKKLEENKAKGTISSKTYAELKGSLDDIQAREAEYRISEEALSYTEAIELYQDLDAVQKRIESRKSGEGSSKKSAAPSTKTKTN